METRVEASDRAGSRPAPEATVVVVNWNGRAHLERCLPALAEQTFGDFRVVVVDNGSDDGSLGYLETTWPDVDVLALGANAGFAAANNVAVAAIDSDWVALLNNDTVADRRWLEALMGVASGAGERVASVASLMVFDGRPSVVNSAGIAVDPTGIAWDRLGGASTAAASEPRQVFGASAGAGLFRRAALLDAAEADALGRPMIMDERYFMYLEDVDLAWRLRLRGWTSLYEPDARVRHRASGTAGEGSPFKNRLLARNKVWTLAKDYPAVPLVALMPLIVSYDVASVPYRLLLQGQTAAFYGRVEALRRLGPVWAQRRAVQARRRVSWRELSSAMSPLEVPWRIPRRYRHLESAPERAAAVSQR